MDLLQALDVEIHKPARQRESVGERIEQSVLVSFLHDFGRLVILITSVLLVSSKFRAVESLLSRYFRNRAVHEEA